MAETVHRELRNGFCNISNPPVIDAFKWRPFERRAELDSMDQRAATWFSRACIPSL
jgi:hypothetical protein